MKYLLDTNICIYVIRKKTEHLIRRFTSQKVGDIGISAITVSELQYGIQRSSKPVQNQEALDRFLVPLTILDYDYAASVAYGRIRATLEAAGTPVGSLDTLIAAHALSQNLILVTNNVREFSRVEGLSIEDWSQED